ncbi:transcription factor A [Trichonephila clavata]|uniref:Transcription factor A n=1 Tax=Trichonephila clavata TaxID=2740835 RepID=A0A8X6GEG1_TRICU|nr:transcription factor A [Trichonephila clavata]
MAFFRGIVRFAENFTILKKCHNNGWNGECSFSAKKALGIPLPPKKPLTAYMIFCQNHRKELLRENPSLSSTEQIKKLAAQWSLLSLDKREPYETKAREGTVLYGEAHKKYYENLSEEQKRELARMKMEKRESRRLFKFKKALRESGIPKHPLKAYALFVKSEAKSKDIKQPAEFIKECAEKWKNLSEAEKKKFDNLAEEEKKRYAKDFENWRKKVISDGDVKLLEQYEDLKGKGKALDLEEIPKSLGRRVALKSSQREK